MAIISANRYSKMNGNFIIAANESYGVEDMGRILIENERNDQAIFTAAMMNDMHEIKCRTEGTLLESELQALSESSVKQFFDRIIEKLKKFWAKIKGFFKRAYAMITAYVVRNGKAFIAANRKELNKLSNNDKLKGKAWIEDDSFDPMSSDVDLDKMDFDTARKFVSEEDSAGEITKKILTAVIDGYDGEGNLWKYFREKGFKETTSDTKLGDCYGGVSTMMAYLENGMKPVRELQKSEKELEKKIKKAIKELEDAEKKAQSDAKDEKEKEAHGKVIKFYQNASTGITNAMSTVMTALVKTTKFELSQIRIILARAIAQKNVVESTLLESQIREIIEDASEMEDITPTPEETEAAEKLLAAAQELIDSAEGAEEEVGGDEE